MSANLNAPDEYWRFSAACLGRPAEWDYETKVSYTAAEKRRAKQATTVCLTQCPVLDQCRRDILDSDETGHAVGIVAAMTPAQRRAERRKAARNAEPTWRGHPEAKIRAWREAHENGTTWNQIAAGEDATAHTIRQVVAKYIRDTQQAEVAA